MNRTNANGVAYSYTPIPTNLIYLLDNDCFKAISLLIQEESYWKAKGRLNDGYFYKPLDEIAHVLFRANRKDIKCVLDALQNSGLIECAKEEGYRKATKFKICWERIEEIATMSITDLMKFEEPIVMKRRTDKKVAKVKDNVETKLSTDCNTTLDNIYNIEDNKDNINNILYNNKNNIIKEKETSSFEGYYENECLEVRAILDMIQNMCRAEVGSTMWKLFDKVHKTIDEAESQIGKEKAQELKDLTNLMSEQWASQAVTNYK